MEYSGNQHHVSRLTCLHLNNGSQSDYFIHCHAESFCTYVILIVELALHVVKELSDD